MIFSDFGKALRQLGDPRFRRVVWLGLLLSIALLAGVYALLLWLLEWAGPGSVNIPLVGPVGGLDTLLSWGSALFMIVLSVFLMVPVASVFSGLFLDVVAQAVEDRHYPQLPSLPPAAMWDSLREAINFSGLLIGVNTLALFLYIWSGPFIPLAFWALNGLLLGREYFTLVALRRMNRDAVLALRRRHWVGIWAAGTLMAAPLSVPLINLIIPVLGVATFTHLFHRLTAARPNTSPS